jgi:hypothetical protein
MHKPVQAQIDTIKLLGDVRVVMDRPEKINKKEPFILVVFALPNGNSIEQTMGKKMKEGDDWHFDIQHIRAQTSFVRQHSNRNVIVAYLENKYRSWPLWKQKHADYKSEITWLVDTLRSICPQQTEVYLNGHSGGGSFIFGYLEGKKEIPGFIRRINFLDSNYGYDSSYKKVLITWLKLRIKKIR